MDRLTILDLIWKMRDEGWAIVAFGPEDLNDVNPSRVEVELISSGWDVINSLKHDKNLNSILSKKKKKK